MANYTSNRTGLAHDGDEDRLITLENKVVPINGTIWNGQALQDGNGDTITSKYVTLDTTQTITGVKQFRQCIQAYRYSNANNLPFMTFDKPGSYATGIGPDGTGNRIKFGPCPLDGSSWTSQSDFNSNNWYFQGSITGTSTLTIPGGITSNHGQNFMVGGNEVNFIPTSYNSTFWFNWECWDRNQSATVSQYLMGNGKRGYAPVTASAHTTSSSRTIKENIEPLTNEEAQKILQIEPVTFNYIEGICNDTNPQIGVIAEDVEEILPMVVLSPSEEIIEQEIDDEKRQLLVKSVDYSKFTPYLIKMIQIQQEEINTLKQKVEQLEQVINNGNLV